MSLHPHLIDPIPEETARVARAAFPKGNPSMRMRDELAVFYQDKAFANLFPAPGHPADSLWHLALVLQFLEGLSDCQAADGIRSRIGRKFALSLEFTDPGFGKGGARGARRRHAQPRMDSLDTEALIETECSDDQSVDWEEERPDITHSGPEWWA
jgi:transposase